jgi:hypothetical protein
MSPSPIPPLDDDPHEPTAYFTLEQRRRSSDTKPGGEKMPPLPASSPWSGDPVPQEPSINREEDGSTFINQEDQQPCQDQVVE